MPFLYELVDGLYNTVMQFMPESLQNRPMLCAPVLGASGAYGAVRSLQYISRRWMDRVIENFDRDWLPKLEKACMVALPAVVLAYAFSDPQGAIEVASNNPVYAAGMASAGASAMAGAAQDLHNRAVDEALHPSATLLNGERIPLEDIARE